MIVNYDGHKMCKYVDTYQSNQILCEQDEYHYDGQAQQRSGKIMMIITPKNDFK